MNEIIKQAIASRRCMQVFYDGGLRIIEPHRLGISTAGNMVLRCWQRSGFSVSGETTNWKLFAVDKMQNILLLEDTFEPHQGYTPSDKAMRTVIAEVPY